VILSNLLLLFTMKPIRLSAHATESIKYRGVTEDEVKEAINSSDWSPAELGRSECRKEFVYDRIWNKIHYKTKQVRPIFVEEETEIVVITVYSYYY